MERAMGIEPWSEAWEARNKNLKTLELGTLSRFAKPLIWKMKAMEGHLAWRATYVGAEPTGERGLVNSSGFTKLLHPVCPRAFKPTAMPLYCRDGFLQDRSEEHTSELQSHSDLVCRLLLEKKKK